MDSRALPSLRVCRPRVRLFVPPLLVALVGMTVLGTSTTSAQFLAGQTPGLNQPAPTPNPVPPPPTPPPAPVVTPPPTPVVTPPPAPPPAPVSPLFLGNQSDFGMVPSMATTVNQLNALIDAYNATGGSLPDATTIGSSLTLGSTAPVTTTVSTSTFLSGGFLAGGYVPPPQPKSHELKIDVSGWEYLVIKWGEINYHFYVGDSSGVQTFKGTAPLASYSTFFAASVPVSVPDAGSSALLLAAGILPLAVFRRRFRR